MRFAVNLVSYCGDLPPGLLALARQLEAGGDQAPSHVLGPVTALRDVSTTASGVLSGHAIVSSEDRSSVRDDLRTAIDALGPALRTAAAPSWRAARKELGRLPKLLETPDGALMLRGLTDAILGQLATSEVCVAAWSDVRTAFEDETVGARECETRVNQLAEVVRLRGGDWQATASEVRSILYDDKSVLAHRGVVDAPEGGPSVREPAGVSLDRRLKTTEEAIADDPPRGEVTGWVCFAQAWLPATYLSVGGVDFYAHQMWPDGVRLGPPRETRRHPEFDDEWHTLFFRTLPEEPFVIAGVPLGDGLIADAVARARSTAQQLVRAARPQSSWILIPGAAIYVRGVHSGWFGAPLERHDRPEPPTTSPENEPTGRELGALKPEMARAVVAGAPAASAAVRDAEWANAVAALPDSRQRLALGLRLVERCLPSPAGDRWTRSVARYLKEWWIDHQSRGLIGDTAVAAVDVLNGPPGMGGIATAWRQRLTPIAGGLSYNIRLDETVRSIGELLEALPAGSMPYRQAVELSKHAASAAAWLEHVDELGREFDLLLARAARQRNAIVHGADTLDEVIESVVDFAAFLQWALVHDQLDAVAEGESLLANLETRSLRVKSRHGRLQAGEAVISSIFEPNPNEDSHDPSH
jgi:hypothetical protein